MLLQKLKYDSQITRRGDYDILIPPNHTIEVKSATEDKSGNFQFNGVRYDTKYKWLLVFGISPNELYFDLYTKENIATGKAGHLVPMRKGSNSDFKLTKSPSKLRLIKEFSSLIEKYIGPPLNTH